MLDGAMRHRRYGAASALGRLAGARGRSAGPAYEAAALVERGRDDEARALLRPRPGVSRSRGWARASREVLDLRRRGARGHGARSRGAPPRQRGRGNGQFRAVDGVRAEMGARLGRARPAPGGVAGRAARGGPRALAARRGSLGDAPRNPWCSSIPRAGAVRVAVSDRRDPGLEGGTPAFEEQREPAWIQKLITTDGHAARGPRSRRRDRADDLHGSERYGSGSLWCAYPGGPLSGLGHALGISCNVAFGTSAPASAGRPWSASCAASGSTGTSRAPGTSCGRRATSASSRTFRSAWRRRRSRPAHAARLAAVFGAGGNMPGVFLVADEDGAMGLSPHPLPPPPSTARARGGLGPGDARRDGAA